MAQELKSIAGGTDQSSETGAEVVRPFDRPAGDSTRKGVPAPPLPPPLLPLRVADKATEPQASSIPESEGNAGLLGLPKVPADPDPDQSPDADTLPLPPPAAQIAAPVLPSDPEPSEPEPPADGADAASERRTARRRPAGVPSNGRIAANDDVPSIGGLLYALQQSPSRRPYFIAAVATAVWVPLAIIFGWAALVPDWGASSTFGDFVARPAVLAIIGTTLIPVALFWFLAQLILRAQELRLMSTAMSEVAIRLAEPDRMAEQSIASLGQSVRRQVSFMNEAVSRALGRAGELEALVHNEVASLERSYRDNEHKIRSLIDELSGERHALVNTSERVSESLRALSGEVPALIDKLSQQQLRLTGIIESAGQNLIQLETSVASSAEQLESTLGSRVNQLQTILDGRADHLQTVLGDFSSTVTNALSTRTEGLQNMLEQYGDALGTALGMRADQMQSLFEGHARTLDDALANRAQALDAQLIERTRAMDIAFGERLRVLDESIMRSTLAIDGAVSEKAQALTSALATHAKDLTDSLGRQASQIDESLLQGLSAVRRSSENITRQSVKAIEGLSSQADMLRNVSENLLSQINSVTTRFEGQGQSILKAANALESANYRIDSTLQNRNAELSATLDQLGGKAADFDRVLRGYSSSVEGSLSEVEGRARALTQQLASDAETSSRAAVEELERLKTATDAEARRTLEEIKSRFNSISREVNSHIGSLTDQFAETSDEVRRRAQQSVHDLADENQRIREQLESLPKATRDGTDAMRAALQDQLRALEQLSSLTTREQRRRDITPPAVLPSRTVPSLTSAFADNMQGQERPARAAAQPYSSIANNLSQPPGVQRQMLPPTSAQSADAAAPPRPTAGERESWSLGDLLARASREDAPPSVPHVSVEAPEGGLNIESIARTLDTSTASAIWARLRSGQRGIMVRSIYTAEGRTIFDEISRRYRSENDMRSMVDRYLQEFERVMRETERRDPSGRMLQGYLVSESGRVYLFLAHAAGRLS